jgi:HEAT repeats
MGLGKGRLPRVAGLRLVIVMLGLLAPLLALPRRSAGDKVDDSINRLRHSRAYKVRLSAALFLSRQSEPRAIRALARAVEADSDNLVRRVAARSLARAVEGASNHSRRIAIEALERAGQRDRDRHVRHSAQQALDRIRSSHAPTRQARAGEAAALVPDLPGAGRIFVHIGKPADLSRSLPSGSNDTLLRAVRGSLRQHAPDYLLASDVLPTRAELLSRGLRGFIVNAHVARVAVESNGSYADVRCTVSVRVGPWSGRDGNESLAANVSASATGNGHITSSPGGARRAAVDCAVTVAEELAARQVVPFLRSITTEP